MIRHDAIAAIVGAFLLAGCAQTSLSRGALLDEAAISSLPPDDEERFEDADAVWLLYEDRWLLHITQGDGDYFQRQVHGVLRIRSDKGIQRYATQSFGEWDDAELVGFSARTISPDGQITDVDAEQVFDNYVRLNKDDRELSYRSFHFPRVEVGSVLEFTYTQQVEGWRPVLTHQVADRLPIADYRLEMRISKRMQYEMRLFNSGEKLRTDLDGGYQRVSLRLRDVPARKDGLWDPHWTKQSPWWQFRTKRLTFRNYHYKVTASWADAYKWTAKTLSERDDKRFKDFDVELERGDCAARDVRCLSRRALHFVREETRFDGFDSSVWQARELTKVLDTERADNFEKALLCGTLLADAGVDVRYALLNRANTRQVDKRVPMQDVFNHMLLYLPAQPGLDGALFVDPSCEYCDVGQLPHYSREQEALVIWPKQKVLNNAEVEGEAKWIRATGASAPRAASTENQVACALADDGTLTCEDTWVSLGYWAMRDHAANARQTEKRAREAALKAARDVLTTAELVSFERRKCDDGRDRCVRKHQFRVPHWAAVAGDEMVVPLAVLRHGWHDSLTEKERKVDLVVPLDDAAKSELRIALPPGWRVKSRARDVVHESAALRAHLQLTSTPAELVFMRELTLKGGSYPKSKWEELRRPLREWADSVHDAVVLERVVPAE